MDPLFVCLITVFLAVIIIVIVRLSGSRSSSAQEPKEPEKPKKEEKKESKPKTTKQSKAKTQTEAPKRLLKTLKIHSREVVHVEFSQCGRYLASASEDQSIRVFLVDSLLGGSNIQHGRLNTNGDVPDRFCFSLDGNYLLVTTQMSRSVNVYKITKKKKQTTVSVVLLKQFDMKPHHQSLVSVNFSNNSKYILTCSAEDTKIGLFDLNGNLISSTITNKIRNHMARFTPNSQYIAIATFSSDVTLLNLVEDKKKSNFQSLEKAIQTSSSNGHRKGIQWLDFTSDSKFMVSGSDDGTWKLWNIDVNWKNEEEAKCITTGEEKGCTSISFISISPNNQKLACVSGTTIYIWTLKGKLIDKIPNAHRGPITAVDWSSDSATIVSSSEDTNICLWDGNE